MNNIYVVLGPGRSGTSAITRGLQVLGIELKGNLKAARKDNPRGFWEDVDIMDINRTVTRVNGDKIVTQEQLNEKSLRGDRLRAIQATAQKLLQQRFDNTMNWGFKDVRTGEMLPFWQNVFEKMQLKENYIIALRHPLERALSSNKFNPHGVEFALISWLEYLIRVIDQTRDKNCVVVSYELMLQQPEQQLKMMHYHLGIKKPYDATESVLYAEKFLDKKLRHYDFAATEFAHHPIMAVAPLCEKVYHVLMKAARNEINLNDAVFAQEWERIKLDHQKIASMHRYVSELVVDEKNLQRQLKKIQKLLSWKLAYPLRVITKRYSEMHV